MYTAEAAASDYETWQYDAVWWQDWTERKGIDSLGTVLINGTEDSTTDQYDPNANAGGQTWLGTSMRGATYYRYAWLKFPLQAYAGKYISEAKLYIYCYGYEAADTLTAHRCTDQTWREMVITWNNQPTINSTTMQSISLSGTGWWQVNNNDFLGWVRNQAGGNLTVVVRGTIYTATKANWHNSKESTRDPYLTLTYATNYGSAGYRWNSGNHTMNVAADVDTGTINETLTRTLAPEMRDRTEYGMMAASNATGTSYTDMSFVLFTYTYGTANQTFGFWLNSSHITIQFYTDTNVLNRTTLSWSYGFVVATLTLDQRYRTLEYAFATRSRTTVYSIRVSTSVTADVVRFVTIGQSQSTASIGRRGVNVAWVRGPFASISGLRPWLLLGTNSTDSPYYLTRGTVAADKNATVLCMPFQGMKWLWNCTPLTAAPFRAFIEIRWYSFDGSLVGGCFFELQPSGTTYQRVYFGYITAGGSRFSVFTKDIAPRASVGCAVWTEKSGKTFGFIQYTPHSSEFQDFFMYDISAYADITSWGVRIFHGVDYSATYTARAVSQMAEVEIFYGAREGIAQPRFGGMWWEYNPILAFCLWLAGAINAFFGALAYGLLTLFQPLITTLQTNIGALLEISNMLLSGLAEGIGTTFVDVVVPMWADFVASFINAAIALALVPLAAISLLLTGDPLVFVLAFTNFLAILFAVLSWIGTGIAAVVTFLAMIGAVLAGEPLVLPVTANPVIDLINTILFYIVVYAPVAVCLHVMFSVSRCVQQGFDLEPLINCGLFYWHIVSALASILFSIFSFFAGIITSIMELIPF